MQKFPESCRLFFELQITFRDRSCDYKGVLTERNEDTAVIAGILSDKGKVYSTVQNTVDGLLTVCLDRMKINVRMRISKTCEQFWQQIGRRDRGGGEIDHVFLGSGEIFQKVVADLKHPDSTVVELITSGGDRGLFGSADDEPGMKFFFERTYMCTDGRLCQVKASGSFRETAVIDDGDEGF